MTNNDNQPLATPDKLGFLIKPPSLRGIPYWLTYLLAAVGLVYLTYPSLGFFELIPDVVPVIGHLDESVAFTMLWYGLVEFFEGRKFRKL